MSDPTCDGLLLQFNVRLAGATTGLLTQPAVLKEKDYIAVYDKKMLWRANLYIEQQEESLGNRDWNVVHPWNAPPAADLVETNPVWGRTSAVIANSWDSDRWGFNEWNRTYDGVTFGVGNGGQVLHFMDYSWTPLRTRNSDELSMNYLSDRVSYDYIYHNSVPGDADWADHIRAWDSPFDFIYKLRQQRLALNDHFSAQTPPTAVGVFPTGVGNNNIPLPDGVTGFSNADLGARTLTRAPYDLWRFYWKEPENGHRAYIPGLGLYRFDPGNGNNESISTNLGFTDLASAGTDCLAFAERSASYRGNTYLWRDLAGSDRAENAVDPDHDTDEAARNAVYPHAQDADVSTIILYREGINGNLNYYNIVAGQIGGPTLVRFSEIKQQFMRIIPGDIIRYDSAHIGVVAGIDYERMDKATTIKELMASVIVIESVFYGKVNYICKRNMLMGNGDVYEEGSNGSWHLDKNGDLRNWVIERLR